MRKLAVKGNAKYLIALLISGVVLLVLLLRPGPALGLEVVVNTQKAALGLPPAFQRAQEVLLNSEITLQAGEFRNIISATLNITGPAGFTPVTVNLPLPRSDTDSVTNADLSDQLPIGRLFVDMSITNIDVAPIGYGYGYAYGYFDFRVSRGIFRYALRYTPPSIPGDYVAKISVSSTRDRERTVPDPEGTKFSTTTFKVLPDLRGRALVTRYPIAGSQTSLGSEESIPGDLVILQIATDTTPSDIKEAKGTIGGRELSFIDASRFHPALRAKWGVQSEASFLLPVEVPVQTPGLIQVAVTVTDNAGSTTTVTPEIRVVPGRTKFTVYLMPSLNFISTPLLSSEPGNTFTFASAPATGSLVSAGLLLQDVTDFVSPSFQATLGRRVLLSDVVEAIFSFPGGVSDTPFLAFYPGPAFDDPTFRTIGAGKGFIITAREGAFRTHPPAVPGVTDRVPQPIPLVFAGEVLRSGQVPPTHRVVRQWNLVGPHSNTDTFVDVFLRNVQPPAVAQRDWLVLFDFVNSLGVTTRAGAVQGNPADALTLVLGGFQGRRSFTERPSAPQGDPVPLGSGMWLFMARDGLLVPEIR